jgi:hypothetical protein
MAILMHRCQSRKSLKLPDPFQPINFKIDVNDEEEHYARFVVEPLSGASASPSATLSAAFC